MRIAICDDSSEDVLLIIDYLMEYKNLYNSKLEIKVIDEKEILSNIDDIDVLLLDVFLENENGINIARKINCQHNDIKIILCSISPDYSIEGYEVNAYRYLLKPLNKSKLFEYLDNIYASIEDNQIEFTDINHKSYNISAMDICYIDMNKRISNVHLKNGSIIQVIKSLKRWCLLLNNKMFVISHKGVLVNLHQIDNIKNDIVMKNGDIVYLSRKYKRNIIDLFHNINNL